MSKLHVGARGQGGAPDQGVDMEDAIDSHQKAL